MTDINEVRARLHTVANIYEGGQIFAHCRADDVNALLDDHARLAEELRKVSAATTIDLEQFRRLADLGLTFGPGSIRRAEAERLRALIDGQTNDNGVRVDRGALQMAINVLRRAGKDEVADALVGGVIEQPTKGEGE